MVQNFINLASISVDVGAETREFSFTPCTRCELYCIDAAADAANSTDKYTVTLVTGSTTIATVPTVVLADTLYQKLGPDSGQSPYLDPGTVYKVVVTFAGTAASVKGIMINVWARLKGR